jgi:hypothetical protein
LGFLRDQVQQSIADPYLRRLVPFDFIRVTEIGAAALR